MDAKAMYRPGGGCKILGLLNACIYPTFSNIGGAIGSTAPPFLPGLCMYMLLSEIKKYCSTQATARSLEIFHSCFLPFHSAACTYTGPAEIGVLWIL